MRFYYTTLAVKKDFDAEVFKKLVFDLSERSGLHLTASAEDPFNYMAEDRGLSARMIHANRGCIYGFQLIFPFDDTEYKAQCFFDGIRHVITLSFRKRDHSALDDETIYSFVSSFFEVLRPYIRITDSVLPDILSYPTDKDESYNVLPVTDKAISLSVIRAGDVCKILNDRNSGSLPVIYLSTSRSHIAFRQSDADRIARSLYGQAVVIFETDAKDAYAIKKLTGDNKPSHGKGCICYPAAVCDTSLIDPSLFFDMDDAAADLVEKTRSFWENRMRASYDLWDSILREQAEDHITKMKNDSTAAGQKAEEAELKRKNSEAAAEKARQEKDDLYASLDETLKSNEKEIKDLKRKVSSLEAENEGLRKRLDKAKESPLLVYGSEKGFYATEIKDIILDSLNEYLKMRISEKKSTKGSRRSTIISDILKANQYDGAQAKRKDEIKDAVHGAGKLNTALKSRLEELGFTIAADKNHYKLAYHGDPRYVITVSKTSSDNRTGENLAAELIKTAL